jgi:guanine deaminase
MAPPAAGGVEWLGLRGHLIDAPTFGQLRSWREGAVVVDSESGRIAEVGDYGLLKRRHRPHPVRWTGEPHHLIIPGLVDTHAHLPQYPAVARGDGELLSWLRQSIFPLERDFSRPRAQQQSPLFFFDLARHGTTSAMVSAAIFEDSADAAFEAAAASGLRITLGQVMMDVGSYGPLQPKKILSVSLLESESLCRKWHGANEGLLQYVFSPRFAVSCSDRLMRGAAELAKKYNTALQASLAESLGEIEKVKFQFSWSKDYTDVYEQCGLLAPRSVFGHCIHLSPREIAALAKAGAKVAHCPTSNLFLGSGIMALDRLREAGLCIGLASDVAAGPELNLWTVMRAAIESQRARSFYDRGTKPLKVAEAFHLGTQAGAEVMGSETVTGSLDAGKEADLTVINVETLLPYGRSGFPRVSELSPQDLIALCIYRGNPTATVATYVRGRKVYEAGQSPLPSPPDDALACDI